MTPMRLFKIEKICYWQVKERLAERSRESERPARLLLEFIIIIMQSTPSLNLQEYFQLKSQTKKPVLTPDSQDHIHIHSEFVQYLKARPHNDMASSSLSPQSSHQQLLQLLHTNNNLCFYGLGSKIEFVEQLAREAFEHLNIFVVNGYLPQVNERNIINNLVEWLNRTGEHSKVEKPTGLDSMATLRVAIEKIKDFEFVVVIHNLDGPNLMNAQTQLNISELGKAKNIRLMATIDNTYIGMRWAPNTLSNFGFLFWHVSTGLTYIQQLKFRFRSDQKHDRQQQALRYIWHSLTLNQKDILKIIAKRELANLQGQPQLHYTFKELLDECVNQTVLSNETQLRENLFEIIDHKVVEDISVKNRKAFTMNYDRKILQNIVSGAYE